MKIEKAVPIPPRYDSLFVKTAVQMAIGDSVKVETMREAVNLSQAIRRRHIGGNASMRQINSQTWRVWRIS
jgi:hypothetical protein